MPNLHRRMDKTTNPLKMRRIVMLRLGREQSIGITALARKHGLVDESGAARGVETVRLLLVVGITPGASARSRAAVAARINAKMMVSSLGARLASTVGAVDPRSETPMFVPSKVRLRIDAWLAAQLSRFIPAYRDGHGKVQDTKIIYDFMTRGMADPGLEATAEQYAKWINPFRAQVVRMEVSMRQSFAQMAQRWVAATGLPAAASGG